MWKEIIDEIARREGLTEAEIGRMVGVSQPTINRLRHGKQEPTYRVGSLLISLLASLESTDDSPLATMAQRP